MGEVGPAEGADLSSGEGWSPGAARATPAASRAGALRRGRPRRQVRVPGQARTGNPPQRPREMAVARTASGHEHQGDEASRQAAGKFKGSAPAWLGEKCAPPTTSGELWGLPEPAKGAFGVPSGSAAPPLDRTRPSIIRLAGWPESRCSDRRALLTLRVCWLERVTSLSSRSSWQGSSLGRGGGYCHQRGSAAPHWLYWLAV